jgi:hypothetical protein
VSDLYIVVKTYERNTVNTQRSIEKLVSNGDIPNDAEVVSENNKIVVISRRECIVARIGNLANAKLRDDPHDLSYSHKAAWLAGDFAPVVKPLHETPIVSGDHLISSYPLLNNELRLDESRASDIFSMARDLGMALPVVESGMSLRAMNVPAYVQERLDHMLDNPGYNQSLVEYVNNELQRMNRESRFSQLVEDDRALVHGDFKADNVVADNDGNLKAIDLDAVAIGPRLYDLASWRLRSEMGDKAPVEEVVNAGRQTEAWREDSYRSLIGWKAISSMSFTLRYEAPEINERKVAHIAESATILGGLDRKPL